MTYECSMGYIYYGACNEGIEWTAPSEQFGIDEDGDIRHYELLLSYLLY